MDALAVPPPIQVLLVQIIDQFQRVLGDNLVGIYLHGSLAFRCFDPDTSDVDFLVVVQDRLDATTKRRIAKALVALSSQAPKKGLEMSIVTRASLQDFQYPTPYEFHFGNEWIDRYLADEVDFEMVRTDPDLAAHCTIVRERGVRLVGEPIEQVIPPIPRHAYLQSIANDAAFAGRNITLDPVYGVLNLCRTLAFIREGLITSKVEGGQWGLTHVPPTFVPLVQDALGQYARSDQPRPLSGKHLQAFAEYATHEITRVLEDP